jgi:hypothetical protein
MVENMIVFFYLGDSSTIDVGRPADLILRDDLHQYEVVGEYDPWDLEVSLPPR